MYWSSPERCVALLALSAIGLMACDTVQPSQPTADAAEAVGDDVPTRRGAGQDVDEFGEQLSDGVDQVSGPDEPSETEVDAESEETLREDLAARYLPVPTGPLGGERPAKVFLPDDYDPAQAWPLVMLLHGYGVDGFLEDYYLEVSTHVDERGFIMLLPDGTKDLGGAGFWNSAPGCCNRYGSDVDDASYLIDLVEEAMEKYRIDEHRVVLLGHSNGGYMSHQLACDRADLFTAIASIAGTSYADMDADCAADEPVSVLQIHGTLDLTVNYVFPFAGVGTEETAAWWVERNGCDEAGVVTERDYDSMIFGEETEATVWSGGESGAEVALWKMVGTGHIPLFESTFIPDVLDFLLLHSR